MRKEEGPQDKGRMIRKPREQSLKKGVWWAVSIAAEKLSNTGDVRPFNVPGDVSRGRKLTLEPELKS